MQATGLKTTKPAYNRNLFGALFAVVVLAAVVSALIIATSGRISIASTSNAVAPAPAYAHDLPEAASGAASTGGVYDTRGNRVPSLDGAEGWTPAGQGRVLPIGDERNVSATSTAPTHRTFDRRHGNGK